MTDKPDNYLLLSNPKTGGSTLNYCIYHKWHNFKSNIYGLKDLEDDYWLFQRSLVSGLHGKPGHYPLRYHKIVGLFDIESFVNSYKIVFVRNPYDKLVSVYHYSAHQVYDSFEDFIYDLEQLVGLSSLDKWFDLESKLGFNDFHSLPQYIWLTDGVPPEISVKERFSYRKKKFVNPNNTVATWSIDFLGRFENYAEDSNAVLNILNTNYGVKTRTTKKKLKESVRNKDYRPYYINNKMIDIVGNVYSIDLRTLGYSYE
jgi:hypothetical protein